MLSHHEFATLVLVSGSSDPTGLDRADMDALLAYKLVTLERLGPNHSRPQVTIQGYAFLKALGRVRASEGQARQASL
ncbi:hypothetical protein E6A55_29420 [Cupriavidus necator H16]|uniref:Preprotein translocase subunit SecA n=1 Tax=Cupriavidus necator (strain ATCC 17699 / DSM 428 / KCTC 22496 / NCIMB 10442 / H16 / Stanier 337) TaxID=381666 RepID=Q0JZM0_CUPNH|nr:hypothetical protein C265_19494 [Cupriavidus sp. GA3-3]KUE90858.1 hypothetical protein ASL20_01640 [Cupriavidus necator]QCC04613.1 hypothetical protein E6A55_29420 [Cupriavidus necator H16]CAJ96804.1 conserved hypothetical protein [Cupriavidus necator H16]